METMSALVILFVVFLIVLIYLKCNRRHSNFGRTRTSQYLNESVPRHLRPDTHPSELAQYVVQEVYSNLRPVDLPLAGLTAREACKRLDEVYQACEASNKLGCIIINKFMLDLDVKRAIIKMANSRGWFCLDMENSFANGNGRAGQFPGFIIIEL